MPRGIHSTAILVVVFVLGLAAGIAGMVWAWPGVHARYFGHKHEPYLQHLQTTLRLTPQQVSEVQGVLKGARDLSHQIHLQYQPQYDSLCEQFVATHNHERDEYLQSPQRQKLLDQLHGIMTSTQWAEWQQMQSQGARRPRKDPCGHSHNGAPPAGSPAAKPQAGH